jgi:hypothetical protein
VFKKKALNMPRAEKKIRESRVFLALSCKHAYFMIMRDAGAQGMMRRAFTGLVKLLKKILFGTVIVVFMFFLLYSVKTVLGINIFDDISIVDFFGILRSIVAD